MNSKVSPRGAGAKCICVEVWKRKLVRGEGRVIADLVLWSLGERRVEKFGI